MRALFDIKSIASGLSLNAAAPKIYSFLLFVVLSYLVQIKIAAVRYRLPLRIFEKGSNADGQICKHENRESEYIKQLFISRAMNAAPLGNGSYTSD